ncbi:snRNA-activating protein complex subunit 1 [Astyanax mexicanus]|uniref:Small nuclear RNA activating complex polypeptide 1 n=1 Tax=Astyanax mexicanus TaxID=7994 RepID=A0A8B9KWZ9_ASTMX|nr:snRNA-activating protein complex subunit 1 [Astyanax mexicanus]
MTTAAVKFCDYFWVPFKSDCEELLGRFQQTDSVRYEEFAAIWRDMDFSSVFYGMTTRLEKRTFTRLAFATVYSYFLPPYSFQIRAGALYMFYGLYHAQIPLPKEKIWIALKDWVHIQNFVSEALSCQHLDVVYVYRKLESEKVFYYTAMPKQLTFDAKRRFLNKDVNEEFQDRSARVAELLNADTLDEITNVQNHYEKLKQGLPVTSSISVTTVNLTSKLQECILEFQHWQEKRKAAKNKKNKGTTVKEEEGTQDTEFECSMRADLLASIKSKSYSRTTKASRSRRHRQVEMDTSGSGTDHAHEYLETRKNRPPSLKARTCKNIITIKKDENDDRTQHWLLSSREEDRKALKRPVQRNRFKL